MIAICNQQGAFLYNCSEAEADERIEATIEKKKGVIFCPSERKACLDFTKHGERRMEDGMCGWLFNTKNLIQHLIDLHCEAIYLMESADSYIKYTSDEFPTLNAVFQKLFEKMEDNK